MPLFNSWFLEYQLEFQCTRFSSGHVRLLFTDAKIILIPTWVGQVCLLLGSNLTTSELAGCKQMTSRAYGTFLTGINGVSAITGANTLDIASIGIDLGLLTANESLVTDAYGRVHGELVIKDGIKADGIRSDGSFGKSSKPLKNLHESHKIYRPTCWDPLQRKLW